MRGTVSVPAELRLDQAQRVHMIGIGGSGMAALSSLLLQKGKHVSGSDVSGTPVLAQLRAEGATIFDAHAAANLGDEVEYLVRSSAVPVDNPEVLEAQRRGLPNRKLAEAVGELIRDRT